MTESATDTRHPALAPCASRDDATRGRVHPEAEHPYRRPYERDRDRIIHSTAFRRLEYKTQVFANHEGDHYRTRLTHTFEVAQIARTLARALGLNETLTETAALAHDLGHPPFGHTGEGVMDDLLRPVGGFEHNVQGLRIVDQLESAYPDFPGLNLTYEVRESFAKHHTTYDDPAEVAALGFDADTLPPLEVQVVNLADEIAYSTADVDDGLRSELLEEGGLADLAIWKRVADGGRELPARIRTRQCVRRMIDLLVTDIIDTTRARLKNVDSAQAVRRHKEALAASSAGAAEMLKELGAYLMAHFYSHHYVTNKTEKAEVYLRGLYEHYTAHPESMPEDHRARTRHEPGGLERVAGDYIAGMTDRYAEQQYLKRVSSE